MNKLIQRGVLSIAGLTAAAGMVAGPGLSQNTTPAMAGKPAAATQQVSVDKLLPNGVPAGQSTAPLNGEQTANAKAIIEATKKAGMDERAAVVAIATALQESKLENLGHLGDRNDHDSQGLFQQRPSSGWGTVEQITDPEYSTIAFLKGLKQVDGWKDMPLTQAAQKVQVSAYPDHYAQWEKQAADLVAEHWNS
ncbi:hypothetical protein O7606_05425 [Micromonospora sp. WMMD882]|uniref:hypothetical protein n=1 Tax=Micromonospora sp. WMMD882 TaxID=3015151 RepID=UPI00248BDE8C|nr:hypothetical protein [Micromonospora sp. WMMD882]WBB80828.1 hypothetical protein O7606_05425 [Micromonospora sp. WMMD882]